MDLRTQINEINSDSYDYDEQVSRLENMAAQHAVDFARWVSFEGLEIYHSEELATEVYNKWLNRNGNE